MHSTACTSTSVICACPSVLARYQDPQDRPSTRPSTRNGREGWDDLLHCRPPPYLSEYSAAGGVDRSHRDGNRSTEDDVHEGYFIPKGSYIIANLWYVYMLYDAQTYPDPMAFNPERFMTAPGKAPQTDPRSVTFGFGRRICPGLHLADASVWLTIATALALFKIAKPVDANGTPIEPSAEYVSGSIIHPPPYKCDIMPRSAKAKALLDAMVEQK
ncbi:cytochrome P450 [Lenzites betulinus]|nr:cytochrome P450 [Lenzites betulinus]